MSLKDELKQLYQTRNNDFNKIVALFKDDGLTGQF